MRHAVPTAVVLFLFTAFHAAEPVTGQVYYGGYRPYGWGAWGGAMPYGGTAAGSYAAGMGQMIQAQGAYNQMTAQAAISAQQARSLALDNKLKSAQTYYQLQRLNQENRAEQERQRLAAVKSYTPPPPKRLNSEQLDPVSGKISWPAVLSTPNFEPERGQLDALFAQRAKNMASVSFSDITAAILGMRNKLDAIYGTVDNGDFFAARHFLEGLTNEGRASGMNPVAMNN